MLQAFLIACIAVYASVIHAMSDPASHSHVEKPECCERAQSIRPKSAPFTESKPASTQHPILLSELEQNAPLSLEEARHKRNAAQKKQEALQLKLDTIEHQLRALREAYIKSLIDEGYTHERATLILAQKEKDMGPSA